MSAGRRKGMLKAGQCRSRAEARGFRMGTPAFVLVGGRGAGAAASPSCRQGRSTGPSGRNMSDPARCAQDRCPAPRYAPCGPQEAAYAASRRSGSEWTLAALQPVLARLGGLAMPKRRLAGDPELVAIRRVLAILATLDPQARVAAARYVLARVEAAALAGSRVVSLTSRDVAKC
jgi:hypothetical protein